MTAWTRCGLVYPTLSTGGRCISLSSPNGVGNWFHKTYTEAEEGKNDFNPIRLPWDVHPDRDQEWFAKETRNMSRREIAQELECSFNQSGEGVFHPDDMEVIRTSLVEPTHKTGMDRNFWIWEGYQEGAEYLLVGDVARGDGKDHSAFHIWRLDTFEQVAEYQGKPNLDDYSHIIYDASKEYGFCLTVVENNSLGIAVLEKLKELNHQAFITSVKGTHQYVDKLQAEAITNSIIGFSTTPKTRPLIIAKLEEFVRNKLIKINSARLYNEMTTFIWNNGRAEAQRSYNDDLVMATAISCWVRDTALVVNQRELDYRKAMLSSISTSKTKYDSRIENGGIQSKTRFFSQQTQANHKLTHKRYIALLKDKKWQTRNPRNKPAIQTVDQIVSGPLVNYEAEQQKRFRRRQLDKYGTKFTSLSGKQFKKTENNIYENYSAKYYASQNKIEDTSTLTKWSTHQRLLQLSTFMPTR